MAWIARDIGQVDCFRLLVPEDELRLSGTFDIRKHLVVMLICPAVFDEMPLPRDIRIEVRVRILPPPKFVTLPVVPENYVYIAIAVNVVRGPTRFNRQKVWFNRVA